MPQLWVLAGPNGGCVDFGGAGLCERVSSQVSTGSRVPFVALSCTQES